MHRPDRVLIYHLALTKNFPPDEVIVLQNEKRAPCGKIRGCLNECTQYGRLRIVALDVVYSVSELFEFAPCGFTAKLFCFTQCRCRDLRAFITRQSKMLGNGFGKSAIELHSGIKTSRKSSESFVHLRFVFFELAFKFLL